jgi:hypothetical protein
MSNEEVHRAIEQWSPPAERIMSSWSTYAEITATAECVIRSTMKRFSTVGRIGVEKQHLRSMAKGAFVLWAHLTHDFATDPKREADYQRLSKLTAIEAPE